jgi:chemotaxis signal transduction protein
MSSTEVDTFVEVRVGPFRLALPAALVLGVVTDVPARTPATFRDRELPFFDLAQVLGLPARERVPYAAALETDRGELMLGIDAVTHVRAATAVTRHTLPRFGLARSELFAAVLADTAGLVLLLDIGALAQHVFQRFDPARGARV